MSKSTHFIGQPVLTQLLKCFNKDEIHKIGRSMGGERYVKRFNTWDHLVVMLYAAINRFDSLREITLSMEVESRTLEHLGLNTLPCRSTLSDANKRRPHEIFERIYRRLYEKNKGKLSSDSSRKKSSDKFNRLHIIDSTTITLFSNLLFKGAGRNPKTGKKKGGLKCHTIIHANEGVPSDVCFTSAATNDQFMLIPAQFKAGDILAFDRAYINYEKFEQLSQQGVIFVTKMKKNLTYETISTTNYVNPQKQIEWREEIVQFSKKKNGEEVVTHQARIITYVDNSKAKPQKVKLLTNNLNMRHEEIIDIYKKRWEIELLFKQIKQNFPLRYFYGESANAIKIQVWIILIANLLLTLLQRSLKRSWSFSNLATIVRITLMSYIDIHSLLEDTRKDWKLTLQISKESPPQPTLFDWGGLEFDS